MVSGVGGSLHWSSRFAGCSVACDGNQSTRSRRGMVGTRVLAFDEVWSGSLERVAPPVREYASEFVPLCLVVIHVSLKIIRLIFFSKTSEGILEKKDCPNVS